jgi:hypothetical protein
MEDTAAGDAADGAGAPRTCREPDSALWAGTSSWALLKGVRGVVAWRTLVAGAWTCSSKHLRGAGAAVGEVLIAGAQRCISEASERQPHVRSLQGEWHNLLVDIKSIGAASFSSTARSLIPSRWTPSRCPHLTSAVHLPLHCELRVFLVSVH